MLSVYTLLFHRAFPLFLSALQKNGNGSSYIDSEDFLLQDLFIIDCGLSNTSPQFMEGPGQI